jgi:hypothetical protein
MLVYPVVAQHDMHFTAQFIDLKQAIDPVYPVPGITSDRLAMDPASQVLQPGQRYWPGLVADVPVAMLWTQNDHPSRAW